MQFQQPVKSILTSIIFILLLLQLDFAQTRFSGLVFNKETNSSLTEVLIQLDTDGEFITTDSTGHFTFYGEDEVESHTLDIYSLGCHRVTQSIFHANSIDTITIVCPPVELDMVQVTPGDPESIVRKAIEKIPVNYPDSSYAVPAFYRQYQRVNGKFQNLIEAGSTVLFRMTDTNNKLQKHAQLSVDEAFGVNAIRRSAWHTNISDLHDDDYVDLMEQNPVFHLSKSSFTEDRMRSTDFEFLPATNDSVYVISYTTKNVSSENHGIQNYSDLALFGEADESGLLFIDKKTFAFITIERRSVRNDEYNYPKYNNFLHPDMTYTIGFKNAYLLISFRQSGNVWYPAQILHAYTNEFFTTATNTRAFVITDYFEWYAGEPFWILDQPTLNELQQYASIYKSGAVYDPAQWTVPLPPFYFADYQKVITDLETDGPLGLQFIHP